MSFTANMRRRLQPLLPPGSFGNWIMLLPTLAMDPAREQIGTLAAAVRREVLLSATKFYKECAWLKHRQAHVDLINVLPTCNILSPDGMVACSNWDWSKQDAAFGKGCAPVWVQGSLNVPMATFAIAFRELDGRGGYWVWLCLHRHVMQQLLDAL
jgi:hypothetical protein